MFPVPWPVVDFVLVAYAVTGMAIGTIIGWLFSLLTGAEKHTVKDALFGFLGYFAGFVGCILLPWPENTVVKRLEGGGTVSTTMNTYQHPVYVAIAVAILLPLMHELYRWKKRDAKSLG